jgi:hypothetical protein
MDVVKRFTGEIASRLSKASTLPTTAQTLSSQGLREHAFDTLMNVETLIFETTAWLNASSTINRETGGRTNRLARTRFIDRSLAAPCCFAQQGLGAVEVLRIPAWPAQKVPTND